MLESHCQNVPSVSLLLHAILLHHNTLNVDTSIHTNQLALPEMRFKQSGDVHIVPLYTLRSDLQIPYISFSEADYWQAPFEIICQSESNNLLNMMESLTIRIYLSRLCSHKKQFDLSSDLANFANYIFVYLFACTQILMIILRQYC